MSQTIGRDTQETWCISPLASRELLHRRANRLPRKILAGSFAGLFLGVALSMLIEPSAHADSNINQPLTLHDFLQDSAEITPLAQVPPPISRHQLMMEAEISEDYRHRIPAWSKPERKNRVLAVTATAYNNLPSQTDDTPDIAAWGDRIEPGMALIAVSRDLLKVGLKRGMKVRVSGLEGEFVVLDKMNRRYKKRIDIYMGKNVKAARQFGKRKVTLSWNTETPRDLPTLVASAN